MVHADAIARAIASVVEMFKSDISDLISRVEYLESVHNLQQKTPSEIKRKENAIKER